MPVQAQLNVELWARCIRHRLPLRRQPAVLGLERNLFLSALSEIAGVSLLCLATERFRP